MSPKNPTSDLQHVPTFWDVFKELPGPSIQMPKRKWGEKEAANNPASTWQASFSCKTTTSTSPNSRFGSS